MIAIVRDGQSTHNPAVDFRLAPGDVMVLLGSHKDMDQATEILSPREHD
jgi:Trk K+ transport system NAD-binding subunit